MRVFIQSTAFLGSVEVFILYLYPNPNIVTCTLTVLVWVVTYILLVFSHLIYFNWGLAMDCESSGRDFLPLPSVPDDVIMVDDNYDWKSEQSCDIVRNHVKQHITGNKDCLVKYNVLPLCQENNRNYYRVTVFMRDYLNNGWNHSLREWKRFHVVTTGNDTRMVSVKSLK